MVLKVIVVYDNYRTTLVIMILMMINDTFGVQQESSQFAQARCDCLRAPLSYDILIYKWR